MFRNNDLYRILLIIIILPVATSIAYCQTKSEIEERLRENRQKIDYATRLLQETTDSRKESFNRLLIINQRIKLRNELVNQINNEIINIEAEIDETNNIINMLTADLEKIKKEYAKLIYYAYKNRNSYNRLMFILSSEDFNQAYRRIKYLQQYTNYRKKQKSLIESIQEILGESVEKLEVRKEEKEVLIQQKISENNELGREKVLQNNTITNLKNKEQELRNEINEKNRIAAELKKAIDEIIAEEARKARERESVEMLTPEEIIIGNEFQENRGRLPWPTERGIVTCEFGEQDHPVIQGIKIRCDGIDISTTENSYARAVFNGVVSRIFTIPGANIAVIIKHGNYFTVYQNIVDVMVKVGDNVTTKQPIGVVFSDKSKGNKSSLHFRIYENREKLNPKLWLSKTTGE